MGVLGLEERVIARTTARGERTIGAPLNHSRKKDDQEYSVRRKGFRNVLVPSKWGAENEKS